MTRFTGAARCAGRGRRDARIDTSAAAGAGGAGGFGGGGSSGSDAGAAFLQWELDGGVVATLTTFESGRYVSMDCAQTNHLSMGLITSDNSWAGLTGKLPLEGSGLTLSGCTTNTGDTVERYHLEADVKPQRISGSFEIRVRGAGPRTGSTLTTWGWFDVTPAPQ